MRDRPRSGRVTTLAQGRRIRLLHLRDRFMCAFLTVREIPGLHNNRVSAKTVIRRLRERRIWTFGRFLSMEDGWRDGYGNKIKEVIKGDIKVGAE